LGDLLVRSGTLIAVAIAAAALSGCEKKAEGQTVAIVNGEEITTAELNAELANSNVPAGADRNQVRARVLQTLIDRRLLAQHAREEGLDKSPEFLNRHRRMTEDLLIGMLASRQISSAQLPSAQEITRFQTSRPNMFAQREQWALAQIRYEIPRNPQVQAQIRGTRTLDQLAQVLTANRIPFERGQNRLDTAVVPPALYGQLATLSPGEPFIVPVGNFAVASAVVAKQPAPIAGDQARPIAVQQIRREQSAKFMQDRLAQLRQQSEIEYASGFAPPAQNRAGQPAQNGAAPANSAAGQ
jgi:peptidyl-prolyl cis-trans isomerase C